jgi:glutamate dehydrogenase (NADP+)
VATSALEIQQNAARDHWSFEQTESRLAAVMRDIHTQCRATAEAYGGDPDDQVLDANVAGFLRVAKAMMEKGVI